ncbi:hypothetical protein BU23DRAFT_661165 [Bimuria novae-zelandiae CBS 107.79]|uniref:BZIP domain-containing protein n=1 Tax=Bimuria novae-zelandiae CBS 107.79 TaxID=1447943 RepID=A0A6A5UVR5_9PLEO|nr:hypothetical protein BU23DRAFT_661165 [Bimuria novae-zelandiae CBS 107.79]
MRAIDREARRSLREKTKTHIAELERTIEVLRNQDKNGAMASLLAEIQALRAENGRLKGVIDGVRTVIGGEVFGRMAVASSSTAGANGRGIENSSVMGEATIAAKPPLSPPSLETTPDPQFTSNALSFTSPMAPISRSVDLDGMTVRPLALPISSTNDTALDLGLPLEDVSTVQRQEPIVMHDPDSPSTAAIAPFLPRFLRSRLALSLTTHPAHRNPLSLSTTTSSTCPLWHHINEIFGKIFSFPAWLRPSLLQASTAHPIAIDMFAWPTLRNRLVHQHVELFRDSKLSHVYAEHLRFEARY